MCNIPLIKTSRKPHSAHYFELLLELVPVLSNHFEIFYSSASSRRIIFKFKFVFSTNISNVFVIIKFKGLINIKLNEIIIELHHYMIHSWTLYTLQDIKVFRIKMENYMLTLHNTTLEIPDKPCNPIQPCKPQTHPRETLQASR